jgi:indole-3-glycerol phosphate synthase
VNVLDKILDRKRVEVSRARAAVSFKEIKKRIRDLPPPRAFSSALRGAGLSVIAEIKKASPSKGVLANDFDPVRLARDFAEGGASALSVLTDEEFFQGQKSYIQQVKSTVGIPILRKDFIIDEYQVYESRSIGADAILLIVRAMSQETLRVLSDCAQSLGLSVLTEVHDEMDVQRANQLGAEIVGINNRDLSSFDVSLQRSLDLRPMLRPTAIAVSESGISTRADVARLREAKFNAILVGESLMKSDNRIAALQGLLRE